MVLRELSTMIFAILLLGGLIYWIYTLFQKYRFAIKYKILKRKFNEADVKKLIQYLDAGLTAVEVEKLILLNPLNRRTNQQVKEVIYIYSELQKIERRKKNE